MPCIVKVSSHTRPGKSDKVLKIAHLYYILLNLTDFQNLMKCRILLRIPNTERHANPTPWTMFATVILDILTKSSDIWVTFTTQLSEAAAEQPAAPCSSSPMPMGVFQRLLSIDVNSDEWEQESKPASLALTNIAVLFAPWTKLTCLAGNKNIELRVKLIWVKIQGEGREN